MNGWHVDFSRPGWRCPDCTWAVDTPDGLRLVEACDLHADEPSLRTSA